VIDPSRSLNLLDAALKRPALTPHFGSRMKAVTNAAERSLTSST
jgi:hypothetical protein